MTCSTSQVSTRLLFLLKGSSLPLFISGLKGFAYLEDLVPRRLCLPLILRLLTIFLQIDPSFLVDTSAQEISPSKIIISTYFARYTTNKLLNDFLVIWIIQNTS